MRPLAKLPLTLACGLSAVALLSGCGATTYGTGVGPGTQTVKDLANVARILPNRDDEEPIEYRPRAGIVAPPSTELPPPGAASPTQTAANWPTDPEEIRQRMQADADAARASGSPVAYDPGIRVEEREAAPAVHPSCEDDPNGSTCMFHKVQAAKGTIKPNKSRGGSVDELGTPTRRYLVEPPVEYREPSPDAPLEVSQQTEDNREGGGLLKRLWPF